MKKEEYHAIIVDKSLSDLGTLKGLNVIGQTNDEDWVLYKISVGDGDLNQTIKIIQNNMGEGSWYFHFYNEDGSKMVIVFKDKIFNTNNVPDNWTGAVKYGQSLGIPTEQLDFTPNKFTEERY